MGIGREGTLGSAQGSLLRRWRFSRDLNEVGEGASRFGGRTSQQRDKQVQRPGGRSVCLVCLSNSREARVATAEPVSERG